MKRRCLVPDCQTHLTKLVPEDFVYCGIHQYALRLINIDLTKENFTQEDKLFILYHLKGCSPLSLALHLQIPYANISYYIRQKKIRVRRMKKNKRNRIITQIEMVRVISIVRNWVSIQTIANGNDVFDDTLRSYAHKGHFGLMGTNLQGELAISIIWQEYPDEFIKRFEEIKARNLDQTRPLKLDAEFIPLSSVAHYCGIDPRAVYYWYNHDILPSILKDGIRVATRENFILFLERVARGETRLRPGTTERLKSLLPQT